MAGIRTSISGACLGLSLLIAGCGTSSKWVGTWTGERELPPGEPSPYAGTLKRVTLAITQQGAFTLIEAGMPRGGTIREDGDMLRLRVETAAGRPVPDPSNEKLNPEIIVEALPDGTLRLNDPGSFDSKPLLMKRDAQPPGSGVRKD